MINFEDFCVELFQILRAYSREMVLYDRTGNRVYEPSEARRFYLTGDNILISISEKGDDSSLKLYLSPSLNLSQVSGFIETLRVMASNSNLLFHVKKYDKEIRPQDFATKASVNENQELSMNIMEGMYGTSKSSYLNMENARMIVRHAARINENMIGSRGRHIKAIFVENAQGERFLFPVNVLAGARAMTQHVNQGGTFEDQVGAQIIRMATDFRNLAKIAHPGAKNLVADQTAFAPVRESAISAMKQSKLAFARLASDRSYVRESQKLAEASSLMENSDDLSENLQKLQAILGESFDEAELNTYARVLSLTENEVVTEDSDTDDAGWYLVSGDGQCIDGPHQSRDEAMEIKGEGEYVQYGVPGEGGILTKMPIPRNGPNPTMEDTGMDVDERSAVPGLEVDEYFEFKVGDMVQPKDSPDGEPFAVIDVNGDIVTVKDEEGNTGKMSAGDLEPASHQHIDLPISNNESIQQFESWMEEFNPDTFLKKEKVEEMPSIRDMQSGFMKSQSSNNAVGQVRGGKSTVTLRDGREFKSMGPTKSSQMVAGTVVLASYNSYNQGADVVEVLGYRTDHHGDEPEFSSLKEMAKKYGASTLAALDAAVNQAKGGEYGNGVYMCVKDLDDGSHGAWFYVSGGRFCRGSGAERLSFTKLEQVAAESMGESEELTEYRVKNPDAEPETSMHDLKTLLNHHKAELSKMSPFDPSYGKMRSEIKELEAKIAKNAPYGKSVEEDQHLDEYRIKKDVEPEVSIHDLKSTLQSLEIKLKSMSPFDPQYGSIRSQMRDVERQIAKNAPYGKSNTVDEAERQPGDAKLKFYKIPIGNDSVDAKKIWAFANTQDVLTIEDIRIADGYLIITPHWDDIPSASDQERLTDAWISFDRYYETERYNEDGEPV